ncbi:MAG: hypothetical protein KatS3mg076_1952 [Candidatus Binatia bacterium]|nr:MAG: hypothetical protein KatS3mg076_1952 [Candidatus Binatia bacterium]
MPSVFLVSIGAVWFSTVGYLVLLALVAAIRRRRAPAVRRARPELPAVAVVVPTWNESPLISRKLANLAATRYPSDRIRVLVADGGSSDGTAEIVRGYRFFGNEVPVLTFDGGAHQAAQISMALDAVPEEIVVVTDADAELAPDCLEKLVLHLLEHPRTAVVGALVEPETGMPEEAVYWWLRNLLWSLEGEALGCANVSGVCFAARRSRFRPGPRAHAFDIRVALCGALAGWEVRLCRAARARELRVPQGRREFLRFRVRRGTGFLRELLDAWRAGSLPRRLRVACVVRLWNLLLTPFFVAAAAVAGSALLSTRLWWVPPATTALAFAPLFALPLLSSTLRPWARSRLPIATLRCAFWTWQSLLRIATSAARTVPS